jgi:hypothetical protein
MNAIQVFIPRIVGGISANFLKETFKNLNVGNITYLDMRSRINSNNYSYSFAFATVELFETDFAKKLVQKLKQTGHAQLAYDERNYWEIKDYVSREKRAETHVAQVQDLEMGEIRENVASKIASNGASKIASKIASNEHMDFMAPSDLHQVDSVLPQVDSVLPQVDSVLPQVDSVLPPVDSVLPQVDSVLPQWMCDQSPHNNSIAQISEKTREFESWMNQTKTPISATVPTQSRFFPVSETQKCLPPFETPKCFPKLASLSTYEPSIPALCQELMHNRPWTYPQLQFDAQHPAYYPSKYLSSDHDDYMSLQREIDTVIASQNTYRLF